MPPPLSEWMPTEGEGELRRFERLAQLPYARAGVNALGLLGVKTYPPAILWVVTQ